MLAGLGTRQRAECHRSLDWRQSRLGVVWCELASAAGPAHSTAQRAHCEEKLAAGLAGAELRRQLERSSGWCSVYK